MAARAELRARATLDSTGFTRGISQMQSSVRGFASGQISNLAKMVGGAFAVSAVAGFARNVGETADNLQDLARGLGINVEQLQALQVTAARTGASAEQMNAVLMRAAKAGVGIEEVAKAYLGLDNTSMSVAEAQKIVGKGAAGLNDTFNQIANDGLANMTSAMLNANQIMSEDTVNAAATMQEAYEKTTTAIGNFFASMLVNLAKGIVQTKNMIGNLGQGMSASQIWDKSWEQTNAAFAGDSRPLMRGAIASKVGRAARADNWQAPTMGDISVSAPQASDALARIGGIVGGQTNPMKGMFERQEKIMEEQKRIQEKIEEHAKKTAEASERTADAVEGDE